MKKNEKYTNKYISLKKNVLLTIVFACAFTSFSFASNVIYSNQNNNVKTEDEIIKEILSDPYYSETTALEPYAETYEEPTGVRVADNLKKFGEYSSKTSKSIIRIEDTEDEPITADTIKYIKHTQSITIVPEGSYFWEKTTIARKWKLGIFDKNTQRQAQSGFYMVDGKTYYFDDDGYMYVGTLMDERDTVYIFAESGEMIYKNPA